MEISTVQNSTVENLNESADEVEITVTCENCDLNLIFESNVAEEKSSQTDFILADNQSCSSIDYEDSLSVLNGGDEKSVETQATAPPSTPLFSPWFFWLAFKSWLPRISFRCHKVLCCLIHLLNMLLTPTGSASQDMELRTESMISLYKVGNELNRPVHKLEVEGSIVHIMKALASHPGAVLSLIEDDSFKLLFQMVATDKEFGTLPLHIIQLHRHAMQILGLLLVNDNGSVAIYIHARHLIKVVLMAVKDFNTKTGDASYTMGTIDLLLECV